MADYLVAVTAGQREGVIRAAKFPRKPAVIPYSQGKRIIRDFLGSNSRELSYFDDHLTRLETRHRREPEGWMRDEIRRNIEAIKAFKRAYSKSRAKKYTFTSGPIDLSLHLEGVRINTRLDAGLIEEATDGSAYGGGCVLFTANTDATRKHIEERRKTVAALVMWSLEEAGGNIEPLPRLCLSLDVFGESIVKAPTSVERLRANTRQSCVEVAGAWDRVSSPSGYDGPDWR